MYKSAILYKGVWLAPGSTAYQLYQEKKMDKLEQCMKDAAKKERK